jgi:hypothetical protein
LTPKANKLAQTKKPKTSKSSPKPTLMEEPKSTSAQPPVHPFADVCDAPYKPPHKQNFVATPVKLAKGQRTDLLNCSPYLKSKDHNRDLQ